MASASERLREINDAIETREWMGEQLWRALPEIIAVVEQGYRFDWDSHMTHALDALASKLSGDSV